MKNETFGIQKFVLMCFFWAGRSHPYDPGPVTRRTFQSSKKHKNGLRKYFDFWIENEEEKG